MATFASTHKAATAALVSLLTSTLPTHTVLDGTEPPSGWFPKYPAGYVYVGLAVDDEQDSGPTPWTSDWASIGGAAAFREGEAQIPCLAVMDGGDTNDATYRGALLDLLALVEAAVNGSNLSTPGVLWAHVTDVALSSVQTEQGASARAQFVVTYQALIDPIA